MSFIDQPSVIKGNHNLKFGVEVRPCASIPTAWAAPPIPSPTSTRCWPTTSRPGPGSRRRQRAQPAAQRLRRQPLPQADYYHRLRAGRVEDPAEPDHELRPALRILLRAARGPGPVHVCRHRTDVGWTHRTVGITARRPTSVRGSVSAGRPAALKNKTVFASAPAITIGPGQTEDQVQPIDSDRVSTTLTNTPFPVNTGCDHRRNRPDQANRVPAARLCRRLHAAREGPLLHRVDPAGTCRRDRADGRLCRQPGPQPLPALLDQRHRRRHHEPDHRRRLASSGNWARASPRSTTRPAAAPITTIRMQTSFNRRFCQGPHGRRSVDLGSLHRQYRRVQRSPNRPEPLQLRAGPRQQRLRRPPQHERHRPLRTPVRHRPQIHGWRKSFQPTCSSAAGRSAASSTPAPASPSMSPSPATTWPTRQQHRPGSQRPHRHRRDRHDNRRHQQPLRRRVPQQPPAQRRRRRRSLL